MTGTVPGVRRVWSAVSVPPRRRGAGGHRHVHVTAWTVAAAVAGLWGKTAHVTDWAGVTFAARAGGALYPAAADLFDFWIPPLGWRLRMTETQIRRSDDDLGRCGTNMMTLHLKAQAPNMPIR